MENTVTISIQEYDELREIKKNLQAKQDELELNLAKIMESKCFMQVQTFSGFYSVYGSNAVIEDLMKKHDDLIREIADLHRELAAKDFEKQVNSTTCSRSCIFRK
jgi:hypothetical protein